MRVGILKIANPEKGLGKCADTLAWAFGGHDVSLFPVWSVEGLYRCPDPALLRRARSVDVFVLVEQFLPRLVRDLAGHGVRVVFVPNLDCAALPDSTGVDRWIAEIKGTGVCVWSRTPRTTDALAAAGIRASFVGWSMADPVRQRAERQPGREVVFLMNAGRGGWQRRRGVDIALKAFAILRQRRRRVRLILKALRPVRELAGDAPVDSAVSVLDAWLSAADLLSVRRGADVVLHPSRWEGLGYPMFEALHDGVPVLATDGWPMNELVADGRTGLLIEARRVGRMGLAARWECDVEALACAMQRLVDDPDLRARLTCAAPRTWTARQRRFPATVSRALADRA